MNEKNLRKELSGLLMIKLDDLTDDLKLSSLGQWDSFAVVSLMGAISQYCGLVLGAEDLMRCQTVGEIFSLLQKKELKV